MQTTPATPTPVQAQSARLFLLALIAPTVTHGSAKETNSASTGTDEEVTAGPPTRGSIGGIAELPSADYVVARVATRVAAGGHSVAEVDIRRRFGRGVRLFETVFKPLPDRWYHWFSDDGGLRLVEHDQKRS